MVLDDEDSGLIRVGGGLLTINFLMACYVLETFHKDGENAFFDF